MKLMTNIVAKAKFMLAGALLSLPACTEPTLLEDFTLPDGISVTSLTLLKSEEGALPSSGTKSFSIKVELSSAVPSGEVAYIPFAIWPNESPMSEPLCVGWIAMTNGDGTTVTRTDRFELYCDGGKVAGRAVGDLYHEARWDRTVSGSDIKILAKHVPDITSFGVTSLVLAGTSSNQIEISCP
jgi:hypothetical protein